MAALEQHGHHMPVFTDSLLVGEIVRRAEATLHDRVLFAPLMWLGNSEHHLDFPGTMSAAPRAYLDLLDDMVENFLTHGFRRIVLVNGHGGNNVPGQQAMFEVRQRHRKRDDLLLLFASYWALGAPAARGRSVDRAAGDGPRLRVGNVDDAGAAAGAGGRLSQRRSRSTRASRSSRRSAAGSPRTAAPPGHIGDPRVATAAKGETLLKLFTADVVNLLTRL